jgi:hypothetical protein
MASNRCEPRTSDAAQHDPRADAFADPSWELHELPTGHWAMFSLPGPLAELLDRIAAAPSG